MIKIIMILTSFVYVLGCKDDAPTKQASINTTPTATAEENSNDQIINPENTRVLRNGPQFLAAAAKMLELNPATLSKNSGYDELKSKLPIQSVVTLSNPSDSAFIAASKIAAAGCNTYIKENKSDTIEEFLEVLVTKATFDRSIRSNLQKNALNILQGTELEEQTNKTITPSKLVTCSYIVVTKLLY